MVRRGIFSVEEEGHQSAGRTVVEAVTASESGSSDNSIFSWVNLLNSSQGPVTVSEGFIFDEDEVARLEVMSRFAPLAASSKGG